MKSSLPLFGRSQDDHDGDGDNRAIWNFVEIDQNRVAVA